MLFALPGYQFPYTVTNRCLYLRVNSGRGFTGQEGWSRFCFVNLLRNLYLSNYCQPSGSFDCWHQPSLRTLEYAPLPNHLNPGGANFRMSHFLCNFVVCARQCHMFGVQALCTCATLGLICVPCMKSRISISQCCTLCYSIMSHATSIFYYHASMLTQNNLCNTVWTLVAANMILRSLECVHIVDHFDNSSLSNLELFELLTQ
jgi:hypothetical protein